MAAQTVFSPDDFGARHDVRSIWDKSTILEAGVNDITVNKGWNFTQDDVGKRIQIAGVGEDHGPHSTSIVQVLSSNRIIIADSTVTGTPIYPTPPIQNCWFRCDYGTDDTTAVEAALSAALAVNGVVQFGPATYWLSRALSITDSVILQGYGSMCQSGSFDEHSTHSLDMPMQSPYLKGSVLLQTASGENIIDIPTRGVASQIRNLGFRWSEGIRFSNTGHGIYQVPPNTEAGYPDNGILGAHFENLNFWGHDGDHYALVLTNPLYTHLSAINSFGGGGLKIVASSQSSEVASYGGQSILGFYAQVCAGGSSHGIHFAGENTVLGNIAFTRVQATVADHGFTNPPPSSDQKMFLATGLSYTPSGQEGVYGLELTAPDFETSVGSSFAVDDGCLARIGAGIMPGEPLGKSCNRIGGSIQLGSVVPSEPREREIWVDGSQLKIKLNGEVKTIV